MTTPREIADAIIQQEIDVTEATDPGREGEPGAMSFIAAAADQLADLAARIEAGTADKVVLMNGIRETLDQLAAAQSDNVEMSL